MCVCVLWGGFRFAVGVLPARSIQATRPRGFVYTALPSVGDEVAEEEDRAHGHLAGHPVAGLVAAIHPEAGAGVVHVHLHIPGLVGRV